MFHSFQSSRRQLLRLCEAAVHALPVADRGDSLKGLHHDRQGRLRAGAAFPLLVTSAAVVLDRLLGSRQLSLESRQASDLSTQGPDQGSRIGIAAPPARSNSWPGSGVGGDTRVCLLGPCHRMLHITFNQPLGGPLEKKPASSGTNRQMLSRPSRASDALTPVLGNALESGPPGWPTRSTTLFHQPESAGEAGLPRGRSIRLRRSGGSRVDSGRARPGRRGRLRSP